MATDVFTYSLSQISRFFSKFLVYFLVYFNQGSLTLSYYLSGNISINFNLNNIIAPALFPPFSKNFFQLELAGQQNLLSSVDAAHFVSSANNKQDGGAPATI